MDRIRRSRGRIERPNRLMIRRRTHQATEARRPRRGGGRSERRAEPPGRGFVIGPMDGGSDIGFDPPTRL